MDNVTVSVIIGLITGIVSGFIVYILTKRREQNYYIYHYFQEFLFGVITKMGVKIPIDTIRNAEIVGGRKSTWGQALYEIYDAIYKDNIENVELSSEEESLFETTMTAISELEAWKKKKHL